MIGFSFNMRKAQKLCIFLRLEWWLGRRHRSVQRDQRVSTNDIFIKVCIKEVHDRGLVEPVITDFRLHACLSGRSGQRAKETHVRTYTTLLRNSVLTARLGRCSSMT